MLQYLNQKIFRHDLETLSLQLERGDRFLVSSPVQRAFYAGLLLANGRIDPETWAADPSLGRLLSVAPFGVPSEPPVPGPALLRAPGTGIGERDPVLFFGGVYDWYDPEALLSVFDGVLRFVPACRLVFVSSPNPGTTPQGAYARALETARGRGWLGRSVLFVPWFPYESRGAVYLEATAAVLTHRSSLETDLSLRTRGLDFLWAGLPVVSHRGGGIGQLIAETGAGLVVDAEDADGLVDALARVLTDAVLREELAGRGRAAVEAFRWERTLAPVLEFAAAPAFDPLRRSRAKAPARRGGGVRRKISEILARRRRP